MSLQESQATSGVCPAGPDHPALSRQGVSQEGAREGAGGLKGGRPQRDFRKTKWASAERMKLIGGEEAALTPANHLV